MLKRVIASDPALHLLAHYESAEEAIAKLPRNCPHVVLVDLQLPEMDGVACIEHLTGEAPHVALIVLTDHPGDEPIFEALRAGAVGYLRKTNDAGNVCASIHEARNGGSPMSPGIARLVVQHFHGPQPPAIPPELAELSARERSVLDALADGRRYREIALSMGLAEVTIRTYVRRLYQKLQVTSRTEAVAKLWRVTA